MKSRKGAPIEESKAPDKGKGNPPESSCVVDLNRTCFDRNRAGENDRDITQSREEGN